MHATGKSPEKINLAAIVVTRLAEATKRAVGKKRSNGCRKDAHWPLVHLLGHTLINMVKKVPITRTSLSACACHFSGR